MLLLIIYVTCIIEGKYWCENIDNDYLLLVWSTLIGNPHYQCLLGWTGDQCIYVYQYMLAVECV